MTCWTHTKPAGPPRRTRPPTTPINAAAKVGVLLANLGTPDDYDYWSMRRYLNEFLSDRRVIDYRPWLWQPLLQLIILTKRPFTSRRGLQVDLERRGGRKPADDDHQGPDRHDRKGDAGPVRRRGHGRFLHALRQSVDQIQGPRDDRCGLPQDPVLPALSALRGRHLGHRERRVLPRADEGEMAADGAHRATLFRPSRSISRRWPQSVETCLCARWKPSPISWSVPTTACRNAI